jgi:hypothetical protein
MDTQAARHDTWTRAGRGRRLISADGAADASSLGMRKVILAPAFALSAALAFSCGGSRAPAQDTTTVTAAMVPVRTPQLEREFLEHEPPVAPVAMQDWPATYKDASRELTAWRARHPIAAQTLALWAESHPDQFYSLVMWSVTHPYEALDAMFLRQWDWTDFRKIEDADPESMSDFVQWVRQSQYAAMSLASQPTALSWLNRHDR